MSRPIHCNCLCHGTDGNWIADRYFACKNCYSANHMGNLPRQTHEHDEPKKARKPRAQKAAATVNG